MESKHFKNNELTCHCGCGQNLMDEKFLGLLEDLRLWFGKPINLSSAYRCPSHNMSVSNSGMTGPHTTGKAVDILVYGENARCLLKGILAINFTGVGLSQKDSYAGRFIHVDALMNQENPPRPWIWSY